MQQKAFRLFATAVGVDHLRFFDWSERSQCQCLRFTALKNGRAMRARQHRHFAADRTQILVTAPVHSLLFFQNADTESLFLDIIECLRNREVVRLRIFLQDRCFYFFAQRVDRFHRRAAAAA